jgi:HK97 family phage prohead protease
LPQSDRLGVKLEKRADAAADALPDIVGLAAVYYNAADPVGTQYNLFDNVFERIQPGAFDKAVGRDDVRALQNHDPRLLLGRSASKTLQLELTPAGLAYRITPPNTTAGRDTVESLARGDIDGSSFAFAIVRGGVEWTDETVEINGVSVNLQVRNIKEVALFDVGPVTYPAYSAASSGTRSPGVFLLEPRSDGSGELAGIRAELAEHVGRTVHGPAAAARRRRLRLAELG